MTSIEYGGGPTLEQRQAFTNLEEGGHIPGYMGFCPQFKYRYGHSFGKETANIAKELPYYDGPKTQKIHHIYPVISNDKTGAIQSNFSDQVSRKMLPKPTGDNKYTEGMIPGYSGDVPYMDFKFGATYRNLSNECVDEFIREYQCIEQRRNELKEMANLFPHLHQITGDPLVRDHLNLWTDDVAKKNISYKGFVPRVDSTEAGLAKRFHEAARSGLETFREECINHFDNLDTSMTNLDKYPRTGTPVPPPTPNYEGHIHGYKFQVGQNFGNTTRDLEVCAHPYSSYGEYTKARDLVHKYLS
ncbi:unnamed protein product [Heterobilharzia americana]|nr:unnamed protein product [Heterobilharzia americana]